MNTSQIIILLTLFIELLLNANLHGKERKGKHNFWFSLISVVTWIFLLYNSGTFNN